MNHPPPLVSASVDNSHLIHLSLTDPSSGSLDTIHTRPVHFQKIPDMLYSSPNLGLAWIVYKVLKTKGHDQGPVVQSIISLMSSLRGKLLRILRLYYQIY